MKKSLIALFVIAIIAGVVYQIFTPQDQIPLTSAKVEKKDLKITVNAVGKVYAKELVSVATLANGEIKQLLIKQGDQLKKGDVIAILDDVNEQGALETAKARFSNLIDELESAKAEFELAKQQKTSSEKLHKNGAKSTEELLSARFNYANAKARLSAAQANISAAKINIKTAQKALDDTIVRSPIDGQAIAVFATQGQTINSRQSSPVLAIIADMSSLQVRMKIPQNDALKLHPGQQISAKAVAQDAGQITAELDSIDAADISTVSNVAQSAVYYYARYYLPASSELKIGMDVLNSISVREILGVKVLPISFVLHDADGYYVMKKQANEYLKTPVKLGASDELSVEIIEGLELGDEVVVL